MVDEDLLQYLWSQKCYGISLSTTDGQLIQILNPGRWNQEAGPDFLDAKLIIGDTEWAGHVEVHVKSSLWHTHGHDDDPNYDATILHVVWDRTQDRLHIPTVELKDFVSPTQLSRYARLRTSKTSLACQDFTFSFPSIKWQAFRDSLMAERLQKRSEIFNQILEENKFDWSDLLYVKVARALGQKKNGEAMQELAERLPMKTIARHKNNLMDIEALLFGVSGMLPEESDEYYVQKLQADSSHLLLKYGIEPMSVTFWNTGGLRPPNFPTVRIAQFAALLHQSQHLFSTLLETETLSEAVELFRTSASSFWDTHYNFSKPTEKSSPKSLGLSAIYGLIINTVAPVLWSYGHQHQNYDLQERMIEWLDKVPAENNVKIKEMLSIQLPNRNATDSQALIELYDAYCTPRRCLRCLVGSEIMSRQDT